MNVSLDAHKLIQFCDRPLIINLDDSELIGSSEKNQQENWNPDPAGGAFWCVESFRMKYPYFAVVYREDSIILSRELGSLDLSSGISGINFQNLSGILSYAEGSPMQWGIYFARYFQCSLMIKSLSSNTSIRIALQPEDTLDVLLNNWQATVRQLKIDLVQINPAFLFMSSLEME